MDPVASQALFDNVMGNLGYDPNVTTTVGDSPAAIGNRIADQIISSRFGNRCSLSTFLRLGVKRLVATATLHQEAGA